MVAGDGVPPGIRVSAAVGAASPAAIAKAVRNLAADDFKDREQAIFDVLLENGEFDIPCLATTLSLEQIYVNLEF